ncbi:MAG TPA: hypothetical protein VGI39_43930 [Polyangiaceae bacterium]|jgi:hypothetical protein
MPDLVPSPYDAPTAAPPRTPRVRTLALGCGGTLLACVLGVGSCVLLTKGVGDRELNPIADAYFAKAEKGDYRGAYAGFGAGMHAATGESDYVAFDEGVHARLGHLDSKKLIETQAGMGTGGGWARVVYDCHFDKGDAKVQFRFQKEGGQWKIDGLHYDAPVLTDALRLPERAGVKGAAD